jgi:ATP-dependent helicase/nuclease subunit A
MDLLALMQFAILPEDDLTLACILHGPLLALSEEQLMELAIGRKGTLWQSLKEKPAFAEAREYLEKWLNEADFSTPFAMLAHILNEPCPGSEISGKQALWARLGPDVLDPIGELLNAAQEFGHRHAPSLQAFLHWLMLTGAEIKRELDRSGKDRGGNEVRIMTVHAAKGLEAPIVFLPNATDLPEAQKTAGLLWDSQSSAPVYLRGQPQSGIARNLWIEAQQKQMEEYRRLFYVALTRAENRLYICGWENTRSKKRAAEESWYALAEQALAPLHEPSIPEGKSLAAIAFADHGLAIREVEVSKKSATQKVKLPKWARRKAPVESAKVRPLAPSRLAPESEPSTASPDQLYARGRIIHRLLESLPEIEDSKRDEIATRFLASPQHRLPKKEQKEIAAEVLKLLRNPEYAPLFGPGSRAEVPLAGIYEGQPIAGQIDRLCVRGDEVWIVDYKSNRPPPSHVEDVSSAYRKQLAAYRAVLTDIYPGKAIRCFLLWTYGPRLMPIPDPLLHNA